MQLRDVTIPLFILKFCEKREYRDSLLNGDVYFKKSGYFRKLEDGYRGDKNDGKRPIDSVKANLNMTVF